MEPFLLCAQTAALITNIHLYQPINYQPVLVSGVEFNTPRECKVSDKNANAD
jgi:hypothetical protein